MIVWAFRNEIRQKIVSISAARLGGQEVTFAEQSQTAAIAEKVKVPGPDSNTNSDQLSAPGPDHQFSEEANLLAGGPEVLGRAMEWVKLNPGPTVEEFLRMSEHLQFERAFNLVYGSQVLALEFAKTWGGARLSEPASGASSQLA